MDDQRRVRWNQLFHSKVATGCDCECKVFRSYVGVQRNYCYSSVSITCTIPSSSITTTTTCNDVDNHLAAIATSQISSIAEVVDILLRPPVKRNSFDERESV